MLRSSMLRSRKYRNEDFQSVYSFLGRLYRSDRNHPYWLPSRWEYAAYLVSPLYLHRGYPNWMDTIRIWETHGSEIVAIANSENPDENAFLHSHPKHRYIEEELISWAEDNIAVVKGNDERKTLTVWTREEDHYRETMLAERGYVRQNPKDYLKWQFLDNRIPKTNLPSGFRVASLSEGIDLAGKIECAAKAFRSSEVPAKVYSHMQSAPSYRPNLDLCVLKDYGTVVSLCIIWLDKANNIGYFEPVATHPEYQRWGLGKAILTEGLSRLKNLGAEIAYVGAYGDDRSAFYSSAGFTNQIAS